MLAARVRRALSTPGRSRDVLLDLTLVALTLVAHWGALGCGFIWDDNAWVVDNPSLRSVSGLLRYWYDLEHLPAYPYYPLLHTSFWIEHQLFGLNAAGYHATNILLHAGSVLLVRRIVAGLGLEGAWICAALFAVHPVHLESVAWITERKNTLSGVLYLGALLCYLRFAPFEEEGGAARGRRLYISFLLLFLCALLTKTATVTLPAAILVLAWLKTGRVEKRRVLHVLPPVALALPLGLITWYLEVHVIGARGADFDASWIEKILVGGRAFWFYLEKLCWPSPLVFIYPRWSIDAGAPGPYLYLGAALVLLVALWLARGRLGRGPLASLLYFVATLGPALGLFDVWAHLNSYVADHWQYLASLGPFALVAGGLAALRRRLPARARVAVPLALALSLAALVLVAQREVLKYRDLETLWRDTLAKNPGSWMVQNNLGVLLVREGRAREAIPHLEAGAALAPAQRRATARNDLGRALHLVGRLEEARTQLEQAVAADPRHATAHHSLGLVLEALGEREQAARQLSRAIALVPRFSMAHSALGFVRLRQKRAREALELFRRAADLDPRNVEAHVGLGDAEVVLGRPEIALAHLRRASALVAAGHGDPRVGRVILRKLAAASRAAAGRR